MDDLEAIKQKINIVDLIQEYIPLKKAGVNFKASCPFHFEKTPSFMVSPERGIFHCFGCSVGGDIYKFLMLKEGIEFKDALEILAKKAGISLKKTNNKKDSKDRLFETNQKAAQFFSFILNEHKLGKEALNYLKKRGLKEESIKLFNLGYAPLSWDSLTKFLKKRGFTTKEIIDSGLGVASKSGCYDRFRGRIVFPLMDVRDQILGFSGRVLNLGEPKYINSPQTPIFDKSKFLFGINLAKGAIKEKDEAILVEGEMDMILPFQNGIKNIVASKGTALTEGQIELIKRFTQNISLCFDSDLAGDSASRRGIEIAARQDLNIKIISLEGAKDPGELAVEEPEKLKKAFEGGVPIYDYYLQSISKRYNPKQALGKKKIFDELFPIWQKIPNPLVKDHYIQKLAAFLQVKDELVRKSLTQFNKSKTSYPKVDQIKKEDNIEIKDRRNLLEDYLISLLLHPPQGIDYIPNFPETIFSHENLRQIYVLLVIYLDSISFRSSEFKIAQFIENIPLELASLIDRLYLMEIDDKILSSGNYQKEIELVVAQLKKLLIKSTLEKLSIQIKSAQEFDKIESLQVLNKRFRDLSVKLKNL